MVEEYFSDTVMTHGALQDEEIWRLEEVDDAMSDVRKPNSLMSTGLIGGNLSWRLVDNRGIMECKQQMVEYADAKYQGSSGGMELMQSFTLLDLARE